MVPHWVRGNESATITYKGEAGTIVKPLHMLGLGMSVATPKSGITAPAVFVQHDFAELGDVAGLRRRKERSSSSIRDGTVTASAPCTALAAHQRAAAKGAAAVLVRSATGLAMQIPHTGTLRYDESQPKIPAAAISVEDALLIERLAKEGPVQVHLEMDAHMEPEVKAGNVVGEIVGSEHPEQVVVLGGHIDSWDVGQGAQDDGSGIMATFEAVSLIHKLGLKPKRTIRIVFWVNEENGGCRWTSLSSVDWRQDRQSGCRHRDGRRCRKTARHRVRWFRRPATSCSSSSGSRGCISSCSCSLR